MPRRQPDYTILLREKGKRKNKIISLFKDSNMFKVKVDGVSFKRGMRFSKDEVKNLTFNTIKIEN